MGRLEQSVGGLLNTANSALDQVTASTKAILCLPKALRTLSKGFYAISAKTIAQEIIGSVAQVVGQIVDGIIGSVVDAIEAQLARVLEYLKDIDTIIDEVKDFVKGIKTRGQELSAIIKDDQNCTASNSSFFACMLTTAVNELTNKTVSKINNSIQSEVNKITSDIKTQITDKITQSGGVFDGVVNRQANYIDKINNQINILR